MAPVFSPVAQDLEQLRQAAAEGDADALFRLGDLHEQGENLERNLDLAAAYMRLAAERGHTEAQYRYGLYLAAGLGTEADLGTSYIWLARAAESDASIALVAAALRDQVAERLGPEALTAARERVEDFEPDSGPASLPQAAAAVAAAPIDPETLTAELPPTDCGPVRVTEEDSGGALTVTAHLPAGASPDAWRQEALGALAESEVTFDLSPLEAPLCDVLDVLADHPAALDDGPPVTLRDAEGEAKRTFQELDQLVIEIGPVSARRHVFVDYFVHDGDVLHMLPAAGEADVVAEGSSLTLGDPATDGRTWEIGPPFGRDLVVVFATERPLYSGERAMVEPSADYLEFLRNRLASPLPNDAIGATWRVVTTEPG